MAECGPRNLTQGVPYSRHLTACSIEDSIAWACISGKKLAVFPTSFLGVPRNNVRDKSASYPMYEIGGFVLRYLLIKGNGKKHALAK